MYTYVQRPVCKKKIRPRMCTYRWGLERLLAHTYGQGSCTWLGRNGETASSSCSWGATECVLFIGRQQNTWCSSGANRLGWNSRWKRGLAYRRTEETTLCSTGHVRNGILFIRRVWRTAKWRKWTSYSRNGGPVDREGCGVPQNGRNGPPTVEMGSC